MMIKNIVKRILGWLRAKRFGVVAGQGVYIGNNVHIVNGRNMTIGRNVSIRPNCDLFAGQKFKIGDNCDIGIRNRIAGDVIIEESVLFGPDNYISSTDHCYEDINRLVMEQGAYSPHRNGHEEILIGKGSWIGTHCAIIGDVHIGEHCIIGANSVITKDIPSFCVVIGAPAKIIKKYNFEKEEWECVYEENA